MKKFLFWPLALCAVLLVSRTASAQTPLAGRVYDNPNIMRQMLGSAEAERRLDSLKTLAVDRFTEENGRQPDASEMEEIDRKVAEARQQVEMFRKAVETGITVEFTSETEYTVRMKMRVDEDALKAMGVSWARRKAMKAAISLMPEKETLKFFRKENMIITTAAEPDTLYLSPDGNQLSGAQGKTRFTLERIR